MATAAEPGASESTEGVPASTLASAKLLSDVLKSRLSECTDKDGSYFSYVFLDKIADETRKCRYCGAVGSGKLPPSGAESLELFVIENGVVGKQELFCTRCGGSETITSCDNPELVPSDRRLRIRGLEVRYYFKRVTHFEVLRDLMEMLHIAATEDERLRKEKHIEVADFMLQNARRVCEEWCKAEYAELRLKKYLRLREETLLTTYNPSFTPESTEEYVEMYEMMANSFRQNRDKVLLLLDLLKDSLIINPTRSSFMMWVSIAMMHSETYPQFKQMYDPRAFMRVDSSEYQALKDRYLALDVPLGVKKIPVVFILFEIPRFYHYVDFLSRRLGKKKPRFFLTDEERASVIEIEEETRRLGIKKPPKTGKLVSPEAHLDFLTRKEEIEREMIYRSCREKEKMAIIKKGSYVPPGQVEDPNPPSYRPVVMTTDDFKSLLVEHLRANEASVANQTAPPTFLKHPSLSTQPGQLTLRGARAVKGRKESRKGAKRKKGEDADKKTVLVAQVDTEALRQQGFKVSANCPKTTIIASKDGTVEHVLEGFQTPEQVKTFLSKKYDILSQQQGTGYISLPTREEPGGLVVDPSLESSGDRAKAKTKVGRSGKKKKGRAKDKPAATDDGGLSGVPFTSGWSRQKKENFKHQLLKGFERATTAETSPTSPTTPTLASPTPQSATGSLAKPAPALKIIPGPDLKMDDDSTFSERLIEAVKPAHIREMESNPNLEVTHSPLELVRTNDDDDEPYKLRVTTKIKVKPSDQEVIGSSDTTGKVEQHRPTATEPALKSKKSTDTPVDPSVSDFVPKEAGSGISSRSKREKKRLKYEREAGEQDLELEKEEAKQNEEEGGKRIEEDKLERERAEMEEERVENGEKVVENDCPQNLGEAEYELDQIDESPDVESKPSANQGAVGEAFEPDDLVESMEGSDSDLDSTSGDARSKKTARDKFKMCENCELFICDRILVCAGCKKVAYCNYRCQKAHWKTHKKTCSYALRKGAKHRTG